MIVSKIQHRVGEGLSFGEHSSILLALEALTSCIKGRVSEHWSVLSSVVPAGHRSTPAVGRQNSTSVDDSTPHSVTKSTLLAGVMKLGVLEAVLTRK